MEKGKPFKWTVHAFNSAGTGVTGIAASITAEIRADNATSGTATTDTNPTELSGGYYDFSISSAETSVTNYMTLFPSTTAATFITATPKTFQILANNFNTLGIESDGDLTKVNTCDTNTDMFTTTQGQTSCTASLNAYDPPTNAEMEARTIVAANYLTSSGTLNTVTNLTNAPTAGDLTATMKASVNAECDTALTDYDPPTRAELTSDKNEILTGITAGTSSTAASIAALNDFDSTSDVVLLSSSATSPTLTADIKTLMEADNSDLDYLVTELINKKEITIANGNTLQYNDAGALIGTITSGYSDDTVTVSRKAMRQVKP